MFTSPSDVADASQPPDSPFLPSARKGSHDSGGSWFEAAAARNPGGRFHPLAYPMPETTWTPYQRKLWATVVDAYRANDLDDMNRLRRMIDTIEAGEHERLPALFDELAPLYRDRLGPPPASALEDHAA